MPINHMSTARERTQRLVTLEAQRWANLPAIDRANARLARGERYEVLTDDEIDALVSVPEAQYLKALPDALLEAILDRPDTDPWLVSLQSAYAEGPDAFQSMLAQAQQALLPNLEAPEPTT